MTMKGPLIGKSRFIEVRLIAGCALLAAVAVWLSASGTEKVSLILLCIPLGLTSIVLISVLVGFSRYKERPVWPIVLPALIMFTVLISTPATNWPLRAAYFASRRPFDQFAQEVRAGFEMTHPERAGMFWIARAEISRDDIVCLWIDMNPNGNTGFVQCSPDYVPFNLWSMIELDDRWQYITED